MSKFITSFASRLTRPENLKRAEALIQADFDAAVKSGNEADITELVHLKGLLAAAKEGPKAPRAKTPPISEPKGPK